MAYKGICLIGVRGQQPSDVMVRDDWSGNEQPITLDDYISRKIEPDVSKLPWCSGGTEGQCDDSLVESLPCTQPLLEEEPTVTEANDHEYSDKIINTEYQENVIRYRYRGYVIAKVNGKYEIYDPKGHLIGIKNSESEAESFVDEDIYGQSPTPGPGSSMNP